MTTRHPLLQRFSKLVKLTYSFPTKVAFFPTLNDDSAVHCPARKKYPFSSFFCSRIGIQLTRKRLRVTRTCYTDVKINITPEKNQFFLFLSCLNGEKKTLSFQSVSRHYRKLTFFLVITHQFSGVYLLGIILGVN